MAPFNLLWSGYVSAAAKRGLPWALDPATFHALTSAACFYCGLPPGRVSRSKTGGEYPYTGIDRVDNARGYDPGNCVPCCCECNRMKMATPQDHFVEHVRRIARHLAARDAE